MVVQPGDLHLKRGTASRETAMLMEREPAGGLFFDHLVNCPHSEVDFRAFVSFV